MVCNQEVGGSNPLVSISAARVSGLLAKRHAKNSAGAGDRPKKNVVFFRMIG